MEKLTLDILERKDDWEKAVIVFTKDSFEKDFSELERSYEISRDNKYFSPMLGGSSLFGNCLDGNDDCVRLDIYMKMLSEEGRRWEIEYCYITE